MGDLSPAWTGSLESSSGWLVAECAGAAYDSGRRSDAVGGFEGRVTMRIWGCRAGELFLAVAATAVPVVITRGFLARSDGSGGLVLAFVVLTLTAVAVGAAHRRTLGWLGGVGTVLVAVGATLAAWAVDASGSDLGDGVWRAHFLIMVGSLVMAGGATRSGALSRPVAIGGFVTSYAFLGAWGVGLAWLAWALAVSGRGNVRETPAWPDRGGIGSDATPQAGIAPVDHAP